MPTRTLTPSWPVSLESLLGPLRRGPGDPTHRAEDGTVWRATRTPSGPGTLALRAAAGSVQAQAWGPGADWLLDQLPRLLGRDDRVDTFEPPAALAEVVRRFGVPRFGATDRVMEALLPAIIEQKVTGQEAFKSFRDLVRAHGQRAPGPHPDLWLQPTTAALASIPSWQWLGLHIDSARSRAVVGAAQRGDAVERTIGDLGDGLERKLTSLPGVGVWTAAEVRRRAHGDADAVSFGDYHVAKNVGWSVAGRDWDDAELAAYLEPFRPHRARIVELHHRASGFRPRRGPRMAPRRHLPRV